MAANTQRNRTSLKDVLLYHVHSEVCGELEQLNDDRGTPDSTDKLTSLMDGLRRAGVPEHAIHVLRLVPIIHTVWADNPPQPDQRQAVLTAAQDNGIRPGMIAFKLLEIWLYARPDASMFNLWADYVGALHWAVTEEAFAKLQNESVARAQATADAMQTCLGTLTGRSSHQAAVQRISAVFEFGPPK